MSSYNNVEKIKYASEDCVVNLEEYIVFEDERAEQKFVVFKFSNNVNQQLLGMEFEVSQYDIDGNLVEKSMVIYNKFLAKPVQSFVPNAKLKVNYACKTLSVRLVQAAFDRFIWKEGQFLDNSYKFEHYARDEDAEAAKKFVPAAPAKAQQYAPAPARRKGKLPFAAKNATRKNIAKFPAVFNAITCILAIAGIGVSVYLFNTNSTSFVIDDVYYTIQEDGEVKTVAVTGYDGEEKNLTIPAEVNGYEVVRVKERAFENSDITTVQFSSTYLYIEGYAFGGCKDLKTVTSVAEATVMGYAFENCTKLDTVNLPDSTLLKYSLNGCTGVTNLTIGKNGADSLEELFGGTVPKDINYIVGVKPEPKPDPKPDPKPEPGDDPGDDETISFGDSKLKEEEGYYGNDYYEAVDGVLMTVNPEITELSISGEDGITSIDKNAYSQLAKIETLTVYDDGLLTSEVMTACESVKTLIIETHGSNAAVDLTKFNKLANLSIPCYQETPIKEQYSVAYGLTTITLKPSACTVIPNNAFVGIGAKEIVVEKGFTSCGTNIVSGSSITKLTLLPDEIDYRAGVISSDCIYLTDLYIYLQNCETPYENINLSYQYTSKLTISMETLPERNGGDGYLYEAHTYIKELSIFANDTQVILMDFVCGGFPDEVDCPTVTFNIQGIQDDEEQYEWFVRDYPSEKIINS